jgi:hypothetical protein
MESNLFFGLIQRRECLLPTWRGLFIFMFFGVGLLATAAINIQPFLAHTERVPAEVLVVEGWVSDYVLEEALAEFNRGSYSRLYVTGGPIEKGGMFSEYKTFAELGAAILIRMGASSNVVEAVPSPLVRRDRTYASALALKNILHQQAATITGINLVSVGVHARRSHLLFQKALDKELRVGIITIEDRNFDSKRWWKYSEGVRTVTDEFFAYIYASLVFPFVET